MSEVDMSGTAFNEIVRLSFEQEANAIMDMVLEFKGKCKDADQDQLKERAVELFAGLEARQAERMGQLMAAFGLSPGRAFTIQTNSIVGRIAVSLALGDAECRLLKKGTRALTRMASALNHQDTVDEFTDRLKLVFNSKLTLEDNDDEE